MVVCNSFSMRQLPLFKHSDLLNLKMEQNATTVSYISGPKTFSERGPLTLLKHKIWICIEIRGPLEPISRN